MGIFTAKKKDKLVAIFDIGSSSVGGALVHVRDGSSVPILLKSTRTDIPFQQALNFSTFTTDMTLALHKTAQALYHTKSGAPDELVCVLASPWYVSETRIVKIERPVPFIFTKKMANEMLQKEIGNLTTSYQKKYTDLPDTPELIENKILSVSINGYAVDDPIGKRARQLEMHMLTSLAPHSFLQILKSTLSKTFNDTPVAFSSFMTATFVAIRDRYISEQNYLCMDIGGEITDIAVISKNIIKASVSFPFGRQTLFRLLMEKTGKDIHGVQSLFALYSSDTLASSEKERFSRVLDSVTASWSKMLRESIASLPQTISLPKTIFLTTDVDIRMWFKGLIEHDTYIRSMIAEKKPHIISLEGPEFLDMCKVKEGICDPFLMVEAIALMRKN